MKAVGALVIATALALGSVGPAQAQEATESDEEPVVVCPAPEPRMLAIEAATVETVGPVVRASGHVRMSFGNRILTASEASYDTQAEEGVLRNVMFTTCAGLHPDYRLEAREVTLLDRRTLKARGAALYLGRYRVLALPSIRMRIGGTGATRSVFPRPSYDDRDGLTLSQRFRLNDSRRLLTVADLRLTTRHSVQGELCSTFGIDGSIADFPGRYFMYDPLRTRATRMPEVIDGDCDPAGLRPEGAARLRAFGRATLRQRTYDVGNEGLVVYRQPEIGLAYVGRQLNLGGGQLDPRLEVYPQVTASWGRYREVPGPGGYRTRRTLGGVAALNLLPIGPRTALQPVAGYSIANYETGDSFRTWAWAIEGSHIFRGGSFAFLRYTQRGQSGTTPFEFDNTDIKREIQGAFQVQVGTETVGLAVNYDTARGELYEWEALYGHRTDCLGMWVRWNQRLKRLSMDVAVINL